MTTSELPREPTWLAEARRDVEIGLKDIAKQYPKRIAWVDGKLMVKRND